jgi:hypothetical protein
MAMSIVDAVIGEVVAAAESDVTARTSAERPAYVFQNTFLAPVASVAQGNASVVSVTQEVSSATLQEIADAVSAILRALPEHHEAATELRAAENELQAGRVPFGRLTRILGWVGKAEDIALRAPEVVDRVQSLGVMLGFMP